MTNYDKAIGTTYLGRKSSKTLLRNIGTLPKVSKERKQSSYFSGQSISRIYRIDAMEQINIVQ